MLHRPTCDAARDKSGDFPFGDHFKGRKRLWEVRVQFRVKAPVETSLLVGIELENYVPLSASSKRLMGMTVAALKQVALCFGEPAVIPGELTRAVKLSSFCLISLGVPRGAAQADLYDR